MQVIPPIAITAITSSTVPEEVAATYSGATTYALGALAGAAPVYGSAQTVWRSKQAANTGNAQTEGAWWTNAGIVYPIYASGSSCGIGGIVTDLTNHYLYESLVADNTGNALTDTTKWKYIGKTNRWRMFDYTRNNKTSVPLEFTTVFAPGQRIDAIGLAGIQGNSYSVSISSVVGGGVIYTSSGSLNTRAVATWYEHLTVPFTTQPSLFLFDIPPFSDSVVTLTITATSGNAGLGAIGVGRLVYIGATQYSALDDILNFSNVDRDMDGNAVMTQRRNIPKSNQTVLCDKARTNIIRKARADLNGQPAFWYGLDDDSDGYFESVSMLAYYRGFSIDIAYPEHTLLQIELEEV